MPIRAELRHLYRGPEWQAIRERILARANNKCERCGAPNRQVVLRQYGWWTEATLSATVWAFNARFNKVPFISLPWKVAGDDGRPFEHSHCCPNTGKHRWVRIVLTIAHLDHDPSHNDDSNLQALCQWCHLKHDRNFHYANSRRTRAAKLGQGWLSTDIEQGVKP